MDFVKRDFQLLVSECKRAATVQRQKGYHSLHNSLLSTSATTFNLSITQRESIQKSIQNDISEKIARFNIQSRGFSLSKQLSLHQRGEVQTQFNGFRRKSIMNNVLPAINKQDLNEQKNSIKELIFLKRINDINGKVFKNLQQCLLLQNLIEPLVICFSIQVFALKLCQSFTDAISLNLKILTILKHYQNQKLKVEVFIQLSNLFKDLKQFQICRLIWKKILVYAWYLNDQQLEQQSYEQLAILCYLDGNQISLLLLHTKGLMKHLEPTDSILRKSQINRLNSIFESNLSKKSGDPFLNKKISEVINAKQNTQSLEQLIQHVILNEEFKETIITPTHLQKIYQGLPLTVKQVALIKVEVHRKNISRSLGNLEKKERIPYLKPWEKKLPLRQRIEERLLQQEEQKVKLKEMKGEKVFVNQYGKKNDNWIVWEKLWLKIFGSLEKPE